ncbi:hypothetical protein [Catenuloplanes indicus]|uniref:Uncharacterized protein n=1 Tax=Catenuloplanes indicus TaxID=137267 RepID=A0AAE4AUW1_9ACTN|nr:hypothetical protein [Catenuloplanes indicus]MDQ0363347.1 hypothetical protein [Catenuloplanes indicus]MDQ0371669.1 hypothetical protein [Catenuloplanes indicus]
MSAVDAGSVEALLLEAVGRGEFTVDADSPTWFRRNGTQVEYDLYAKLNNLGCDGFLDYDDADGAPVELTEAGREVLR